MVRIIWAIVILLVLIELVLVGAVIFLEHRHAEKTIAWMIILAVLPFIGFALYLVIGRNARKRKLFHDKHVANRSLEAVVAGQQATLTQEDVVFGDAADRKKKLIRLLLSNAYSPLTINNRSQVLTNGKEKFHALFEALTAAREHIHFQYYIFKDDEIGRQTRDLLIHKAQEGVEVRVIIDGLGSRKIPQSFLRSMSEAGIEVEIFFPVRFPFLSSKLNFRNHRKIVIIDGRIGFIGGMNIGDEYLSRSRKLGFWRDTHLKLEGSSVQMLQLIFLNDWAFLTGERLHEERYYPPPDPVGRQLTQIVASGPDSDWHAIRQVFFTALATAEQKIYVETPYFVPDESIMEALKTAALAGLDVRLVVQGIPEYKITYWASRSYFDELLEAGVRVYEYQKGILHSKVLLVDDCVGIVGSANIDLRSFQLNFEVSALVYDCEFVARLRDDFFCDLADSAEVELASYVQRPLSDRLKESGARLLGPLL